MTLATFEDANNWLDRNKLQFTDVIDATPEATEADRIVRSMLRSSFPDDVDKWDATPTGAQTATPEAIRSVAGMLMAAYRYAKIYSEETLLENSYAARLESKAMEYLTKIAEGIIDIGVIISPGVDFGSADFYPNDSTIVTRHHPLNAPVGEPDRKFTIDKSW